MDLNDKKVIVTGGARGIGYGLVKALLNEEAKVGVFDIDSEGLEKLRKAHENLLCIECDITDYHQVESAVNEFFDFYERVDVLVNNAGVLYSAPLISITPKGIQKHEVEKWNQVISINLSSVFNLTVNAVEKMIMKRTKGVIVNVSSVSAAGNPGQTAYSAAKAGVNALTSTWAKELSVLGIRVVGIAPGYTDTESTHEVMKEDILKEVIKRVPLRRLGNIDEIVNGILFLIKNDFINGKTLEIDGGLLV